LRSTFPLKSSKFISIYLSLTCMSMDAAEEGPKPRDIGGPDLTGLKFEVGRIEYLFISFDREICPLLSRGIAAFA
jgi:hypothetical protein